MRWEVDPVRRARLEGPDDEAAEKDAWLSLVLREWGSCGRVAVVDDVAVGYVVYAPPAMLNMGFQIVECTPGELAIMESHGIAFTGSPPPLVRWSGGSASLLRWSGEQRLAMTAKSVA